MKRITLVIMAMASTFALKAQTTFDLDWAIGINGGAASLTIETGDTVRWTWTDAAPHTVTNIDGSSVEDFDSGILTGNGEQFSYTFTVEGVNDYRCEVHPGTMFGTITVEAVLAVEDKFAQNINWFPNPVSDQMTITSLFKLDSYQIHDITGKEVISGEENTNVLNLNTQDLTAGIYFVTLVSEDLKTTIKVIKQ
ncbi:MAG: T9SS type A sorting domain-containing protein [Bacteroidota bacterium]